ncbi:MAG: NAD-glutamate dehydrogenase [Rickettsiales bacterium]|nr:NAD-glutamate dehydrogenase [Rickettsiales bacterium]
MLNLDKEILHETTKNARLSSIEQSNRDMLDELTNKQGITKQDILLLKAYCAYMFQNNFLGLFDKQDFAKSILTKRIEVTKLILKFFQTIFDPHTERDSKEINNQIEKHLIEIAKEQNEEAAVLEKLLELINSTQRTNFYQKNSSNESKNYISLKIDLNLVKDVSQPIPYMTIFVYSENMEGCILRGGKVSRGGIRLSNRKDFFTEILALMKAQKLKNTIIIPDGAKGGFIVKNTQANQSRSQINKENIAAYKTLLRGALDITDNYVNGQITKPSDVVCRDGDDAYLVVAADKGTGNFSDIANKTVQKYNFWLDDAFASGGSTGYNHKDLGITSRSTWVSVEEHFNSIDINPYKDIFSVVAIGSMSGDVCGNGLLLSRKIKLLAAFSSKWIFIDPNPDTEVSFEERKRLFKTPGLNWIDYNPDLISKGGGVFSRNEKIIHLSEEMQHLFKLDVDHMSPENLIKHILTLKVDLLWSGAVGTYIKTKAETHNKAADKDNDILRIDAENLRCKVIAEGANLTLTQAARIKYALQGGLINTDFIDNSGGVDCSDHEVNLKILLNQAVSKNKITLLERNNLLKQMQEEVVANVVLNSREQNYNLSLSSDESICLLEPYISLMSILKKKVNLDCQFEYLPDTQELENRKKNELGLVRPELSILLSYSKRAAYEDLMEIDNNFIQKFCDRTLQGYFPTEIRRNFREDIFNHPLKREICITKLANNIIDHTGIYFFHLAQLDKKKIAPVDLIRAYLYAWEDLKIDVLWHKAKQQYNYNNRLNALFAVREKLCHEITQHI